MSIEHVQAQDLQAQTNFAMTPAGKRSRRYTGEVEAGQPYAQSAPYARDTPTRKRDAARALKLRTVIRYMLERGTLATGDQVRLATHFRLSRQRVNQVVMLERELMKHESAEAETHANDRRNPDLGKASTSNSPTRASS